PTCTAKGAAQPCIETQTSRPEISKAARARTVVILSPAYHRAFQGDDALGGDSRQLAEGAEDRHRVLGRARYERRRALDARARRGPIRVHSQPRPAGRSRLPGDPEEG